MTAAVTDELVLLSVVAALMLFAWLAESVANHGRGRDGERTPTQTRLFGIRCWLATSDNLQQNRILVLTPAPADRIISTVESEV